LRLYELQDFVRGILGSIIWLILILLLWYFIPYFRDLDIRYFILMTIVGMLNFIFVFWLTLKLTRRD